MSSDLFFVEATPSARPGTIGNHVGDCIERWATHRTRATHRVAPTGFGIYYPAEAGRAAV